MPMMAGSSSISSQAGVIGNDKHVLLLLQRRREVAVVLAVLVASKPEKGAFKEKE